MLQLLADTGNLWRGPHCGWRCNLHYDSAPHKLVALELRGSNTRGVRPFHRKERTCRGGSGLNAIKDSTSSRRNDDDAKSPSSMRGEEGKGGEKENQNPHHRREDVVEEIHHSSGAEKGNDDNIEESKDGHEHRHQKKKKGAAGGSVKKDKHHHRRLHGDGGKNEGKKHGGEKGGGSSARAHSKNQLKQFRKAFSINETNDKGVLLFSQTKFADALATYRAWMKVRVNETIEQSSNKFTNFYEEKNCGVLLPTLPEELYKLSKSENPNLPEGELPADVSNEGGDDTSGEDDKLEDEPDLQGDATACDPADSDFSFERDEKCLRYMSNIHNWLSVKPMSSILSTGRTIKFRVYFRHTEISAVMKVSQKKFALEPSSEVMGYYADRYLHIFRVPPTAWIGFPIIFLQAAAGLISPFYAQWFQQFSIDYKITKTVQADNKKYHLKNMKVSLQIWMADVHDTDETILNPPASWNNYLAINPELLLARKKVSANSPNEDEDSRQAERMVQKQYQDGAVAAQDDDDQDEKKGETKNKSKSADATNWSEAPTLLKIVMGEISTMFIFDFVIGNTDRWFGHNCFAYGGCISAKGSEDDEWHQPLEFGPNKFATLEEKIQFFGPKESWKKAACVPPVEKLKQSKSQLKFAFIDQGSSFYRAKPPEQNPYSKTDSSQNLCRFSKRVGTQILTFQPKIRFFEVIKKALPPGIFNLGNVHLLKAAAARLGNLQGHLQSCLHRFGEDQVYVFD